MVRPPPDITSRRRRAGHPRPGVPRSLLGGVSWSGSVARRCGRGRGIALATPRQVFTGRGPERRFPMLVAGDLTLLTDGGVLRGPDVFQARLARIEAASAHVRSFAPTAVTGLLQTEAYMRSLIADRGLPADRVDAFVRARLHRQAGLAGGGREYTIITSAAALGWRLGSRDEMADQVDHIARTIDRYPSVHLGVIPWGAPRRSARPPRLGHLRRARRLLWNRRRHRNPHRAARCRPLPGASRIDREDGGLGERRSEPPCAARGSVPSDRLTA